MISALTTGASSSVNATAPPSTRPPISASSAPWRPLVTQPTGKTLALPGALRLQVDELGRRPDDRAAARCSACTRPSDPAGDAPLRAGRDRLVFLASRFAQVHVHVDQTRADDHA